MKTKMAVFVYGLILVVLVLSFGLVTTSPVSAEDASDNTSSENISPENINSENIGSWVKFLGNPVVDLGDVGNWDEKSIYSMAMVRNGDEYWLFYTGAGDTAHPNHETSIGLATSTDYCSPIKDEGNPIINRATVGYGGENQGIAVFDIENIDNTYYMFLTTMNATKFNIGVMESTDLLSWSNLTNVITDDFRDHAPYVIQDPNDSDKLIMYYSYQTTPEDKYRIGVASANNTSPYKWTKDSTNNPVLDSTYNVLYPYVEYSDGIFTMYYTKELINGCYRIYKTESANRTCFPDTEDVILNVGASGQWDDGYVSEPRKYASDNNSWLYFTARRFGSNEYIGIGTANWSYITQGEYEEPPDQPLAPKKRSSGGGGGSPYYICKTEFFGLSGVFYTDYDGKIWKAIEASSEDGKLTIDIPKNTIALDEDGNRLKYLRAKVAENPPVLPDGILYASSAFDFEPHEATFNPPITLTLTYDLEELPEGIIEEDLVIAYLDDSEWVYLDCIIDTVDNTITAPVSHFTTFAIIGKVAKEETLKEVVAPSPLVPNAPTPKPIQTTPPTPPEPSPPVVTHPTIQEPNPLLIAYRIAYHIFAFP